MKTPFGPPLDHEKISNYLNSHSPEEMIEDTENWDCDPTDLLTIAGIFNSNLRMPEYAVGLYKKSLDVLTTNPDLISSDTNIQGAWATYGSALINLKKYDEAITPLQEALHLNRTDYIVMYDLAVCHYNINNFSQSKNLIDDIFSVDESVIRQYLEEREISFASNLRQLLMNPAKLLQQKFDMAQHFHERANNYFKESKYNEAIKNYEQAISAYNQVLSLDKNEFNITQEIINIIEGNIGKIYLDIGAIKLDASKDQINTPIKLFIKSLMHNNELEDAKKNLLFCMNKVNLFLKIKVEHMSSTAFTTLYNKGFDILKTPSSPGSSDRDWTEAVSVLKQAIQIEPSLAVSVR